MKDGTGTKGTNSNVDWQLRNSDTGGHETKHSGQRENEPGGFPVVEEGRGKEVAGSRGDEFRNCAGISEDFGERNPSKGQKLRHVARSLLPAAEVNLTFIGWCMMDEEDWRAELQDDPRVMELQRSIWAKWRILARDKVFVQQTLQLRHRLELAFTIDPESVRRFFRSYSYPTGSQSVKIKIFLKDVEEEDVRAALRHYIEYVARFDVVMYFRKNKPHFRAQALPPWGTRFHAKILKGHLRPVTNKNGPYIYHFESANFQAPAPMEELIKTGEAKFVRIDDKDGSSILTEIEAFAYHAEGLTFILHRAEIPYVVCLIGEKTSSKTWRAAERTVHALQRQYYGRVSAGKPADLKQILKVAAALRTPGSSKEKAISLGKTENPWSSQSRYSQLKRKVT